MKKFPRSGSPSTITPALTSGRSTRPASFVSSEASHEIGTVPGSAGWLHRTRCGKLVAPSVTFNAIKLGPNDRITFARVDAGQFARTVSFVAGLRGDHC